MGVQPPLVFNMVSKMAVERATVHWPCLLSLLLYVNSLDGEFVHDDIPAVVQNDDVVGHTSLLAVFLNDFWGEPLRSPRSHKSYRPFTTLLFRCCYWTCNGHPGCFHMVNVVLHVMCTLLVQLLGTRVLNLERGWACVTAAIFAVHPVHTEAVSGVVGGADLLATLFTLTLILSAGSSGWSSSSSMLFLLATSAVFTKEVGIVALPMLTLFDLSHVLATRGKTPFVESVADFARRRDTIVNCLVFIVVLLSRLSVLGLCPLGGRLPLFQPQDNPTAFEPQLFTRVATFLYLPVLAFWQLLCPSLLAHDWQMGSVAPLRSPWDPRCLLLLVFYVMLSKMLVEVFGTQDEERSMEKRALRLAFLLLILPYILASNLLFYVGFVIAERILYLPSVGYCLLVTLGLKRLSRWPWHRVSSRSALLLLLSIVLASLAARTVTRNCDWHSRSTLAASGVQTLPSNAKMHYNFANWLKDEGRSEEAAVFYREAIRLWPSYSMAHNNLAVVSDTSAEAERHLRAALHLDPGHTTSLFNFAVILKQRGLCSESVVFLERCVAQADAFVEAFGLLRQLLRCSIPAKAGNNSDDEDEAILEEKETKDNNKLITNGPLREECECNGLDHTQTSRPTSFRDTLTDLMELYLRSGKESMASLMIDLFKIHFDDDPRPHLAEARVHLSAGDVEEAKRHFDQATLRLPHFRHHTPCVLMEVKQDVRTLGHRLHSLNAHESKVEGDERSKDLESPSREAFNTNCSEEMEDTDAF